MSNPSINQELMAVFHEETESLIKEMTKDLAYLRVEQKKEDEGQYVENIYVRLRRYAHTIKGSSGVVGFDHLNEISQVMENVFSCAMEGTVAPGDSELGLLIDSAATCYRLSRKESVSDYRELLTRLKEMVK